jgi:LuxR family transcriptional regulator, quorum-sensing system regulator CciR
MRQRSGSRAFERRVELLRRNCGVLDHFELEVRRCTSAEDLHKLLADVTLELGFDYFALLHHQSLTHPASGFLLLHNYPEPWEQEIARRGLSPFDPVHLACQRTNAGFSWDELSGLIHLTSEHRHVLERARYHGLGAGFTVPATVLGEPLGSISFACRRPHQLPRRQLLWSELIGVHAFKHARRMHQSARSFQMPRLSPREIQCIRLVAAGKSDWETARILNISEETVHQYVKRARAAYDVVTRTQLVVRSLRDGRIGYDDGWF